MPRLPALIAVALLTLLSIGGGARVHASATRFLTGSEDVPLMDGLAEVADTRVVFDTPGGRIVDVNTEGAVGADAVRRYYRDSLPALGWTRDPAGDAIQTWRRNSEILEITVEEGGGGTTVRFNLRPLSL
ncbi:MAG: hypothetical protein PHS60_07700 [Zavarzinia sp.]|nr:hypothetical protein [Zavarzinia sp.]